MVNLWIGFVQISEKWEYVPLDDTKKAADEVIKAVAERGWRIQHSWMFLFFDGEFLEL